MNVYRTLVALAACFAISQTFAQSKINLSGTIIEKETNEPVMAATVYRIYYAFYGFNRSA